MKYEVNIMEEAALTNIYAKIEGYRNEMVKVLGDMIKIPAINPRSGGDGEVAKAKFLKKLITGFGFEMSFIIAMEKATLVFGPDMSLTLHPQRGNSRAIKVPPGDGYQRELAHFIDCIAKGRKSDVVSPESALASVRLVECEVRSALTGKTVPVKT